MTGEPIDAATAFHAIDPECGLDLSSKIKTVRAGLQDVANWVRELGKLHNFDPLKVPKKDEDAAAKAFDRIMLAAIRIEDAKMDLGRVLGALPDNVDLNAIRDSEEVGKKVPTSAHTTCGDQRAETIIPMGSVCDICSGDSRTCKCIHSDPSKS